jgi:hypothetical protein
MKGSTHRTTDDFGVPEVNRSRKRDDGGGSQGRRGPQDGADVAGVLDGVEHDQARDGRKAKRVELPIGDLGDRQNALRRFRFGGAREFLRGDLGDVNASLAERGEQCRAARSVRKLWGDERAAYVQRRPEQLLDGAHAFGREELLALARFPAPEIAR